jgi:hypothetical protein
MANSTLAALTASGALTGTELFYSDNGSADVKVTANQLKSFIVGAGSVSVVSGKTMTVSNTLTLAGTDGASLNVGAGGTLGTAAFVNTGTSGGTVPLLNAGNTFSATQTITPAANSQALTVSGYSLTGANAQSLLDLSGTWNTSGKPSAIKLNITDTASNVDSLLLDLQVGGATGFAVAKASGAVASGPTPATLSNSTNPGFFVSSTGAAGGPRFGFSFESGGFAVRDGGNLMAFMPNSASGGGFRLSQSKPLAFCSTTADGTPDTAFIRIGTGQLELNNGTTGNLNLRTLSGTGAAAILSGTAIPAGGTTGSGYLFSSTSNYGIFFGSGAPTLSAAKGSLYLRSDGSATNNRAYINTDGATTWTALTTAA